LFAIAIEVAFSESATDHAAQSPQKRFGATIAGRFDIDVEIQHVCAHIVEFFRRKF
jgi:hypothetical protein